jgi:CRP-like cAMP-binding protein
MVDSVLPHSSLVERLVTVARRLRSARRPKEAAELLDIAASLSPQGASLRREALELRDEEGLEDFDRELKRRNLEASHALGMAHIYEIAGEFNRAVEMIDLAKLRTPFSYLAYAASAFLHLRHDNAKLAHKEFSQARRLNPLDFRLAVEASRIALEIEEYETALEHAVDAMLLSHWRTERELEQQRRRVDTLARLNQVDNEELEATLATRTTALQKACDHVALTHARIFSGSRVRRSKPVPKRKVDEASANLIQFATELRSIPILQHFPDDQLIALARLLKPRSYERAEVIFREGEPGRDLFLVRQGTIHITCLTPAGTQIVTALGLGSMFGEVSYLDNAPRSASAIGVGAGEIYVIPAEELEQDAQRDPELAVSLLWTFWQALSEKVRSANSKMREFFNVPDQLWQPQQEADSGERVNLEEQDKIGLLREQGLAAHELRLLTTYSLEERFSPNSVIFSEGEPGDNLYIVVAGSVRISRMIAGAGEECLAILERGEVFGEMALIDEQPRSADARAHDDGATVLSINRSLLKEVLSMDPDAAVQFLNLLCRLLCRRLRAMNERLVVWRTLAAHH